ncbi:hypothetical protein PSI22_12205 [Xenorhabdus sp. XENO-7]|uniref:EamA domain-containing protein n=1 Tax=Xenorhabdus aichiensis TaxID=3025874 RepID=A0ABT5M7Y6_9GAMM|nr:hypothetical protein [Xenorhabdus aichiensis]MDC9622376.1 hypothetical protein [Xenorhabdus aichiensis]
MTMWYLKLATSFLICATALAFKDLIIKYLFNQNVMFSQLFFYTGFFSLTLSVIISKLNKHAFAISNKKYQVRRVFIVCISTSLAFLSFKLLSPTVVNIGSKITLPLMILLSSFLVLPYAKKEKLLAGITMIIMLIFFYQSLSIDKASLLGIGILLLSAFFMIAEYMTLSHTVKYESQALVCLVPSVSLILLGIIFSIIFNESLFYISGKLITGLSICGILYFIAYYSGVIRYKLLPPGLAEYPSLMTILIVWPVDVLFFNGNMSFNTIIFGILALILLGIIIREHRKSKLK